MDVRKIVARAEALHERVAMDHTGDPQTVSSTSYKPDVVHSEIEDDSEFRTYAAFERLPSGDPLPEWAEVVEQIVTSFLDTDQSEKIATEYILEVPFVHVFYRLARIAMEQFGPAEITTRLTDHAVQDFQRYIITEFVDLAAQTFHLDYIKYVHEHDSDTSDSPIFDSSSRKWYNRYIKSVFNGRIEHVFESYPVLARRVAELTRQSGRFFSEFSSHLEEDYPELCNLFGLSDLGKLTRITPGTGDRHDDGRTVVLAEFKNGEEVVYKPRSITPEKELYGFQSWLENKFDRLPDLTVPKTLVRDGYGWVSTIESTDFTDRTNVSQYYRGAGSLLCILYILNTTDCHHENIIAGTHSPVLIDAETIVQPGVSVDTLSGVDRNSKLQLQFVQQSVLRTLLLPFYIGDSGNDHPGFLVTDTHDAQLPGRTWTDINTDGMDVEHRREEITPEQNFPTYEKEPVPPRLFVDEIVAGFEETYEAIRQEYEAVETEIRKRFSGIRVRNVLKETSLYEALLQTVQTPEYLEDGVRYSLKINETLSQTPTDESLIDKPGWHVAVFDAERRALARGDIPRFSTRTDERGIYLGDREVFDATFEKTGIDQVCSRVRHLSQSDKRKQIAVIRQCLSPTPRRRDDP